MENGCGEEVHWPISYLPNLRNLVVGWTIGTRMFQRLLMDIHSLPALFVMLRSEILFNLVE